MKLVSNPAFERDAAKARRPSTLRSAAEGLPVNEPRAHLVFLRTGGLLLVKRPETDWRQLQDEYAEYMASLGPWTAADIAEHFTLDYTEMTPGGRSPGGPSPSSCSRRGFWFWTATQRPNQALQPTAGAGGLSVTCSSLGPRRG